MLHEGHQAAVVAVGVQQAHGLVVVAQLAPGPDLEQLLQRAYATGQGQEGVAALGHHGLAFVHARDHMQFVAQLVGQLLVHQRLRDDAHHASAGQARGLGHRTHQAATPTAIDQLPAMAANPAAHGLGGFGGQRDVALA